MREILFRGKNCVGGKWIYGDLVQRYDSYTGICRYVDGISDYYTSEIDRNTLGQYTGLTDKNGNKIFEGDILKISFGKEFLKTVVKFGYYNQTDKILKSHLGFYFDFVDSESYRKDVGFWVGKTFSKIEVIGNTHENPELLKGSVGNE